MESVIDIIICDDWSFEPQCISQAAAPDSPSLIDGCVVKFQLSEGVSGAEECEVRGGFIREAADAPSAPANELAANVTRLHWGFVVTSGPLPSPVRGGYLLSELLTCTEASVKAAKGDLSLQSLCHATGLRQALACLAHQQSVAVGESACPGGGVAGGSVVNDVMVYPLAQLSLERWEGFAVSSSSGRGRRSKHLIASVATSPWAARDAVALMSLLSFQSPALQGALGCSSWQWPMPSLTALHAAAPQLMPHCIAVAMPFHNPLMACVGEWWPPLSSLLDCVTQRPPGCESLGGDDACVPDDLEGLFGWIAISIPLTTPQLCAAGVTALASSGSVTGMPTTKTAARKQESASSTTASGIHMTTSPFNTPATVTSPALSPQQPRAVADAIISSDTTPCLPVPLPNPSTGRWDATAKHASDNTLTLGMSEHTPVPTLTPVAATAHAHASLQVAGAAVPVDAVVSSPPRRCFPPGVAKRTEPVSPHYRRLADAAGASTGIVDMSAVTNDTPAATSSVLLHASDRVGTSATSLSPSRQPCVHATSGGSSIPGSQYRHVSPQRIPSMTHLHAQSHTHAHVSARIGGACDGASVSDTASNSDSGSDESDAFDTVPKPTRFPHGSHDADTQMHARTGSLDSVVLDTHDTGSGECVVSSRQSASTCATSAVCDSQINTPSKDSVGNCSVMSLGSPSQQLSNAPSSARQLTPPPQYPSSECSNSGRNINEGLAVAIISSSGGSGRVVSERGVVTSPSSRLGSGASSFLRNSRPQALMERLLQLEQRRATGTACTETPAAADTTCYPNPTATSTCSLPPTHTTPISLSVPPSASGEVSGEVASAASANNEPTPAAHIVASEGSTVLAHTRAVSHRAAGSGSPDAAAGTKAAIGTSAFRGVCITPSIATACASDLTPSTVTPKCVAASCAAPAYLVYLVGERMYPPAVTVHLPPASNSSAASSTTSSSGSDVGVSVQWVVPSSTQLAALIQEGRIASGADGKDTDMFVDGYQLQCCIRQIHSKADASSSTFGSLEARRTGLLTGGGSFIRAAVVQSAHAVTNTQLPLSPVFESPAFGGKGKAAGNNPLPSFTWTFHSPGVYQVTDQVFSFVSGTVIVLPQVAPHVHDTRTQPSSGKIVVSPPLAPVPRTHTPRAAARHMSFSSTTVTPDGDNGGVTHAATSSSPSVVNGIGAVMSQISPVSSRARQAPAPESVLKPTSPLSSSITSAGTPSTPLPGVAAVRGIRGVVLGRSEARGTPQPGDGMHVGARVVEEAVNEWGDMCTAPLAIATPKVAHVSKPVSKLAAVLHASPVPRATATTSTITSAATVTAAAAAVAPAVTSGVPVVPSPSNRAAARTATLLGIPMPPPVPAAGGSGATPARPGKTANIPDTKRSVHSLTPSTLSVAPALTTRTHTATPTMSVAPVPSSTSRTGSDTPSHGKGKGKGTGSNGKVTKQTTPPPVAIDTPLHVSHAKPSTSTVPVAAAAAAAATGLADRQHSHANPHATTSKPTKATTQTTAAVVEARGVATGAVSPPLPLPVAVAATPPLRSQRKPGGRSVMPTATATVTRVATAVHKRSDQTPLSPDVHAHIYTAAVTASDVGQVVDIRATRAPTTTPGRLPSGLDCEPHDVGATRVQTLARSLAFELQHAATATVIAAAVPVACVRAISLPSADLCEPHAHSFPRDELLHESTTALVGGATKLSLVTASGVTGGETGRGGGSSSSTIGSCGGAGSGNAAGVLLGWVMTPPVHPNSFAFDELRSGLLLRWLLWALAPLLSHATTNTCTTSTTCTPTTVAAPHPHDVGIDSGAGTTRAVLMPKDTVLPGSNEWVSTPHLDTVNGYLHAAALPSLRVRAYAAHSLLQCHRVVAVPGGSYYMLAPVSHTAASTARSWLLEVAPSPHTTLPYTLLHDLVAYCLTKGLEVK